MNERDEMPLHNSQGHHAQYISENVHYTVPPHCILAQMRAMMFPEPEHRFKLSYTENTFS